MGFRFNKEDFIFTDNNGEIKFSTQRKMPAILFDISGTISVDKILSEDPNATRVSKVDQFPLITNLIINNNDYFIMPFFRINGGPSDTGESVMTGGGSVVLRVIRQPSTGEYLGSSLLSTTVSNGSLSLTVNHALERGNFKNIVGDDIINVAYRVYYGRFT
jgi:hypothetical protein